MNLDCNFVLHLHLFLLILFGIFCYFRSNFSRIWDLAFREVLMWFSWGKSKLGRVQHHLGLSHCKSLNKLTRSRASFQTSSSMVKYWYFGQRLTKLLWSIGWNFVRFEVRLIYFWGLDLASRVGFFAYRLSWYKCGWAGNDLLFIYRLSWYWSSWAEISLILWCFLPNLSVFASDLLDIAS